MTLGRLVGQTPERSRRRRCVAVKPTKASAASAKLAGSGTWARKPRILPPGNRLLWMLR